MATVTDVDNINLEARDIFFGGSDLGLTTVGTVNINFGEGTIDISDADQFFGVVKSFAQGFNATVTMEMKRSDYDFLFSTLLGTRATAVTDGSNTVYYIGTKTVELTDIADTLRLRVSGAGSDRSRDVTFWKAAPKFENTQLTGSRDAAQVVQLDWVIFPDLSQSAGREVGAFGDTSVIETDPDYVWISTGKTAQIPEVHLAALTLSVVGQLEQVQAYSVQTSDDSITAAINEAGGVSATDVEFDYDTLSGATNINAGSYIKVNSEIIYVGSSTASSATAGNVAGLVRGVWGTSATGYSNNDTITLQTSIGIQNRTDDATWASSSASNVTVGNTFQGTGDAGKGVVEHVATGSANITATVGATASPNLVVTAS